MFSGRRLQQESKKGLGEGGGAERERERERERKVPKRVRGKGSPFVGRGIGESWEDARAGPVDFSLIIPRGTSESPLLFPVSAMISPVGIWRP